MSHILETSTVFIPVMSPFIPPVFNTKSRKRGGYYTDYFFSRLLVVCNKNEDTYFSVIYVLYSLQFIEFLKLLRL
jgi:hypothetical protein